MIGLIIALCKVNCRLQPENIQVSMHQQKYTVCRPGRWPFADRSAITLDVSMVYQNSSPSPRWCSFELLARAPSDRDPSDVEVLCTSNQTLHQLRSQEYNQHKVFYQTTVDQFNEASYKPIQTKVLHLCCWQLVTCNWLN